MSLGPRVLFRLSTVTNSADTTVERKFLPGILLSTLPTTGCVRAHALLHILASLHGHAELSRLPDCTAL